MTDKAEPFFRSGSTRSPHGRRSTPLRRDEALELLRTHSAEIERLTGIRLVALFGSVARDEARPDSDLDLLVEYVAPVGWTELSLAMDYLERLSGTRVDMMSWDELKPGARRYVEPELVHVA